MIQDTVYNLEVHLQRIDQKTAQFSIENTNTSDISINLNDEREVTKQCLRVCEDARSYIESLTVRESSLLQDVPHNDAGNDTPNCFEAQMLAHQALNENQNSFAEISDRLRERLLSQVLGGDSMNDEERLRLQEDINISKQCLEVCKVATEASRQKTYRIGEVVANGDSDQVVVNTLADLFDIKKAQSTDNSAQLVGSMTEEALRHLTEKRYNSRFGALASDSNPAEAVNSSSTVYNIGRTEHVLPPQNDNDEQSPAPKTRLDRPSPNEMRKRMTGGATD